MGRKGTVTEVGHLCLYLAAEATFTTGVDHIISGKGFFPTLNAPPLNVSPPTCSASHLCYTWKHTSSLRHALGFTDYTPPPLPLHIHLLHTHTPSLHGGRVSPSQHPICCCPPPSLPLLRNLPPWIPLACSVLTELRACVHGSHPLGRHL